MFFTLRNLFHSHNHVTSSTHNQLSSAASCSSALLTHKVCPQFVVTEDSTNSLVYGAGPQCLVGEPETQTNALGRNRPLPPSPSPQRGGGMIIKMIYLWSYHSGVNMAGSLQVVCPHCLAAEAMQYTLKCLEASFEEEPHSQVLPPPSCVYPQSI